MKVCQLCYREFKDEDMAKNLAGEASQYCRTCMSIVGKGSGYGNSVSDEEASKWLEGNQERKAKLNN